MAEIEPISGTGGVPGEPGPVATEPVGGTAGTGSATPPAEGQPPTPVASRPKGLVRWGAALLAVAVLVGAVSVAAALLAAGAATSVVQGWLPNDTVAYLELRADLPGDQRAKVGDILAKFPGFADQASLDAKIDEALNRILEQSGVDWTNDVKPWLGGEVGLAVTAAAFDLAKMPDLGGPLDGPDRGTAPDDGAVALIAVKDAAAATAWISKELGGTQTTETYAGGDITIVSGPLTSTMAFAVRDDVLVLGPEKTVKASLDTAGSGSVASSDSFKAALETAPTAYLGFGYADLKALTEASLATAGDQANLPAACRDAVAERIPAWGAGFVRAEDDALAMTATVSTPGATSTAKNTASAIAAHLPATTVAAIEVRDLGAGLVAVIDGLKTTLACDPSMADAIAQLEQALAAVGGAEAVIGWADDTAVAAVVDGTTLGGGLAAIVTDEAAASATLDQVKALLALAGAGAGITSREEAYGDGTLLVISLPSDVVALDAPAPEIAATVQRGLLALGTIEFVKAVVDTDAAGSLAKDPVYERAIDLAGGDGMSDAFVDVAGLLVGFEAMLPADERSQYETEIKPFLEPFEAFASVIEVPGATTESRAVITFAK